MNPSGMKFIRAIKAKASEAQNRAFAQGLVQARANMQRSMEENADYQRRCRMTEDERRREALDISARDRAERKGISFEQAKVEMIELMTPAYNKVDDK